MFSYFISTSCLHDKDPIKVYEHPSSDSLPWLATLCTGCNPLLLRKVSIGHTMARVGMPGVSGTLLCVPLRFADFDLYPSAIINHNCHRAFQVALVVKNPPANAGDARGLGLIPGSGRSPGVGNGNPFWYSCLGNPMDRGAWWTHSP